MNRPELKQKGYTEGGKNAEGTYYYKWICWDCGTVMRFDNKTEKRKCPECKSNIGKIRTHLIPHPKEKKEHIIEQIEVRKLSVLEEMRSQRGIR